MPYDESFSKCELIVSSERAARTYKQPMFKKAKGRNLNQVLKYCDWLIKQGAGFEIRRHSKCGFMVKSDVAEHFKPAEYHRGRKTSRVR